MNRYGIRAAKYALQLTILFFVFYSVLRMTGYDNAPLEVLWTTYRGVMMLGAIVLFAMLQPFFGYTKKSLLFDANIRKDDLERVMGMCGYVKVSDTSEVMEFRASTTSKKVALMYEDMITVTTLNGSSVMQGPRKEVVKIYFRIGTFIG